MIYLLSYTNEMNLIEDIKIDYQVKRWVVIVSRNTFSIRILSWYIYINLNITNARSFTSQWMIKVKWLYLCHDVWMARLQIICYHKTENHIIKSAICCNLLFYHDPSWNWQCLVMTELNFQQSELNVTFVTFSQNQMNRSACTSKKVF